MNTSLRLKLRIFTVYYTLDLISKLKKNQMITWYLKFLLNFMKIQRKPKYNSVKLNEIKKNI
jgi:hypothetical protein